MKVILALLLPLFSISSLRANQKDSLNSPEPRFFISLSAGGLHSSSDIGPIKLDNTTINILPFFGYRIDRFVFGFGINSSYIIKNSEELDLIKGFYTKKDRVKEFSVMPTIKYYSKFNVVIAVSYIYGKGFGEQTFPLYFNYANYNAHTSSKSEIIGIGATLGYAFKAGKSFLIEPHVGYYNSSIKTDFVLKSDPARNNLYYQANSYTTQYSENEKRTNYFFGIGITYRL
jgi:hypothetical protein